VRERIYIEEEVFRLSTGREEGGRRRRRVVYDIICVGGNSGGSPFVPTFGTTLLQEVATYE
jgi:hypothetical protein